MRQVQTEFLIRLCNNLDYFWNKSIIIERVSNDNVQCLHHEMKKKFDSFMTLKKYWSKAIDSD